MRPAHTQANCSGRRRAAHSFHRLFIVALAFGLFGTSEEVANAAALDSARRRLIERVVLVCAHVEADDRPQEHSVDRS